MGRRGALCARFETVAPQEHIYSLVRSERQLRRAEEHVAANPGIVLSTLVTGSSGNASGVSGLDISSRRMTVPFGTLPGPGNAEFIVATALTFVVRPLVRTGAGYAAYRSVPSVAARFGEPNSEDIAGGAPGGVAGTGCHS
jgi:hypothetical protein